MLKVKLLPRHFLSEAVCTVVHILNRASTRALDTRHHTRCGTSRCPSIHNLRTFDCVTHVKITRSGLKKLDDQSFKAIFVGYEQGSKAYRCYGPGN
jgi:hypothetical protein